MELRNIIYNYYIYICIIVHATQDNPTAMIYLVP